MSLRRGTAGLLVLALVGLLLTGCTKATRPTPAPTHVAPAGATAPVDPAAWALADRLTTATYGPDTTVALVAGLARSGIGTFADPAATRPEVRVAGSANPLRLLDFQAHALAVGVWAGAGYTGAELDTVLPSASSDVPATSALLASYVAAAGSPGAALARALMAGQNLLAPARLRFPAAVLALFTADLTADATRSGPASGQGPAGISVGAALHVAALPVAALPVAAGICSTAANWINDMIGSLFAALKVATPDSVPGAILAKMWGWLLDVAQALVEHLLGALTSTVLGTIRSIAGSVAAVAEQIASVLPYAVKVVARATSGGGTFVLGDAPLPGTFTATVTAGDLPAWPGILADCAAVAKIALADFHGKAVPLSWGPLDAPADPLLGPTATPPVAGVTGADGRALWDFQTALDPGDPTGEQRNQVDAMPVAVHRPELDQARARLTQALLGFIPDLLRPFVASLFKPYVDGLQARLNLLLDARGRGTAILVFHAGLRPTPKPTPRPAASGACSPSPVRPGTYRGTNTNAFTDTITVGGGGLVDHNDATGPVTLTVAADGSLSGTWSYQSHEVSDENVEAAGVAMNYHSDRVWSMTAGKLTGTACRLGLTGGVVTLVSCTGVCGSSGSRPGGQSNLPDLGAPVSVAGGHVVWQWHSLPHESYTDTFTITVDGPQ